MPASCELRWPCHTCHTMILYDHHRRLQILSPTSFSPSPHFQCIRLHDHDVPLGKGADSGEKPKTRTATVPHPVGGNHAAAGRALAPSLSRTEEKRQPHQERRSFAPASNRLTRGSKARALPRPFEPSCRLAGNPLPLEWLGCPFWASAGELPEAILHVLGADEPATFFVVRIRVAEQVLRQAGVAMGNPVRLAE